MCLAVEGPRIENVQALLVRQTHASLTGTTLKTFERAVALHELADGSVKWFGGSARKPAAYRYAATGAELTVGGLDRPEKFLSSDFDRIAIDEITETTQDAYEVLISRLRGTAGTYRQLSGACNPNAPTHWVKARADSGQMGLLHSIHADNPAYFRADGTMTAAGADYMRMLDGLTGMRRKRLLEGKWSAAEGLVFEEYNPRVHMLDKLPAGSERWPRWWGIDFGYVHPFTWVCYAEDGDGRLYLTHEIHMTGRLVEDHVRTIKSVVCPDGTWLEPRPSGILADHDAEGRATFERHFLSTRPAHKKVNEGVEAMQARLRVQPDGKPRLYLVNGALVEVDPTLVKAKQPTCLADELLCYAWPPNVKPGKDVNPVKEFDDSIDPTRYVIAERDLGRRPRYRAFETR